MGQFLTHAPAVLYKFRGNIERDSHELLRNRRLWLARGDTLNDPFDCEPSQVCPPHHLQEFLIRLELSRVPVEARPAIEARLRLVLSSSPARRRFFDGLMRDDILPAGVLSFCAGRDNPLLWAHYASNAQGFAVGYRGRDESELKAVGALPVHYDRIRPVIWPFGDEEHFDEPLWHRVYFRKSHQWRYEREWRFVRLPPDGGSGYWTVPAGSIVEVCLGPNMTSANREIVRAAARDCADKPRVFDVRRHPTRYALTFHEIDA